MRGRQTHISPRQFYIYELHQRQNDTALREATLGTGGENSPPVGTWYVKQIPRAEH